MIPLMDGMPVLDMELPSRIALVYGLVAVGFVVMCTLSCAILVVMIAEVASDETRRLKAWVRRMWKGFLTWRETAQPAAPAYDHQQPMRVEF